MKNKKISFLLHCLVPGGASISFLLLLRSLQKLNIKSDIFVSKKSPISIDLCSEKRISDISFTKIPIKWIFNDQINKTSLFSFIKKKNKGVKESVEIIKKSNTNILHINTSAYPHILKEFKKHTNIKIVLHDREMLVKHGIGIVQKYFIKQISKYVDAIITISDNEANLFERKENVYIIPNPVDFEEISLVEKNYIRNNYNLNNDVVIISMFGYFGKEKGHIEVLKICKELKKKIDHSKFKFAIVGVKKPKEITPNIVKRSLKKILHNLRIRTYVEFDFYKFYYKNKLQKNVILIDYTSDVYKFIKDSDIIIRPSLSADPWGRDVIEAMAFSKPVVATGKSKFYVEPNVTGFLVEPKNSTAMVEKLEVLINDKEKREKMGIKGYNKIKTMCDMENYADKIMAIYDDL